MAFTHYKAIASTTEYLGAYCFQPGEEKVLTIKSVTAGKVYNVEKRKDDPCRVAHFVENVKPMVINATNGKMITKLAGTPYVEQWVGLRIVVGVEPNVRTPQGYVEAIRVRDKKLPQIKTAAEPEILCEDCGQPIKAAGKMTPAQVAALGKEKFGAAVCATCGAKRKAAAEVKPDEAGSAAAE